MKVTIMLEVDVLGLRPHVAETIIKEAIPEYLTHARYVVRVEDVHILKVEADDEQS